MKKFLAVVILALVSECLADPLSDGGPYYETVNGVKWTFMVKNGSARLGQARRNLGAISTSLTGAVTVPDTLGECPVTDFNDYAFYYCNVSSVTYPSTVTNMGKWAFGNCASLSTISVQSGVVSVGERAFSGCGSLTSISFSDSVNTIGEGVFEYCGGLTSITVGSGNARYKSLNGLLLSRDGKEVKEGVNGSVTIPSGVVRIGKCAFSGRNKLSSIVVPAGVAYIGDYAFSSCSVLTSVALPSGVIEIGDHAFAYCYKLASANVPSGATTMGNCAFYDCRALTSISIPSSVVKIGDEAFSYCGKLSSLSISAGVGEIGKSAFLSCHDLVDITIPSSISRIGADAFTACSDLSVLTIQSGVEEISDHAFSSCRNLKSVSIPASTVIIGTSPFACCYRLEAISVAADNPYYKSTNDLLLSKDGTLLKQGVNGNVKIPSGVTSIANEAFRGYSDSVTSDKSGLISVEIPASVTNIGDSAFESCDGLTDLVLPSGLTHIGASAFDSCSGLVACTFKGEAPTVGEDPFYNVGSGCVANVYKGTTGWDDDGDGKWQGLILAWQDPVPFDAGVVSVDGWSGKYDGNGHGVAVSVDSKIYNPTIGYALASSGPFVDELFVTNVADSSTVWCRVAAAGYVSVTNSAAVTISAREVTITSGSGSKKYDGVALTNWTHEVGGDGFVACDVVTCTYDGKQTAVGSSKNVFACSVNEGAGDNNYRITKIEGSLVVTAGDVGDGSGDEPGSGIVPEGGISRFDATYCFDGSGHTINTQLLYEVTLAGATPEFSFATASNGVYRTDPFVYTNAGKYVVWYKISAENYNDYVHSARLTITNKPVSVKSAVAHQRYPWNGLVDIDVTFDGEPSDLSMVECVFSATNCINNTAMAMSSVSRVGSDIGSDRVWCRRYVWDAATDLGEGVISNVIVTVGAKVLGVQLWKDGPYWAECNIGTTEPAGYGRYFAWGDTMGYTRESSQWLDENGYANENPFCEANCETYGKDFATLQSLGYVDSSGNLVAEHDAATRRLGTPWRMPTINEFKSLINKCKTQWISRNGVYGRLVSGIGEFADKSIFLPAAGEGSGYVYSYSGTEGVYWSSSVKSTGSTYAQYLTFSADELCVGKNCRNGGHSIRPVIGFDSDSDVSVSVGSSCVTAPAFMLHVKNDGVRQSSGTETLRYSALWDGGTNSSAKVTISLNGAVLEDNITSEGDYEWSVTRNGTYDLAHTTYTNGIVAKVLTATFVVSGKEPPAVLAASAVPRYPWNGMVDVDFTIGGDAATAYEVSFAAKDVAGGTNLVMKTVEWVCGGASQPESAPFQLVPGTYRFVWNAAADLPDGKDLERVAITVEAK